MTIRCALTVMTLCYGAASAMAATEVLIGYVAGPDSDPPPLSLAEPDAHGKGITGARLGIDDNNTTGRFTGQHFTLALHRIEDAETLTAAAVALAEAEVGAIVADLDAPLLVTLADHPALADALIFNIRASDDRLRAGDCRANLFHIPPSRAMKADALAQYLATQRWSDWVLIAGERPGDEAYAAALRRAATKFGARIVAERRYAYTPTARRSDIGVQQVQRQMNALTQRLPEHDVLVVADESEVFGEYLPYRARDPRPVVGTHGLIATAWHRSHEQWGATQLQRRFTRLAGRPMLERDYAAWLAVRVVGEAATRTRGGDRAAWRRHVLSGDFTLAGFKGVGLDFRPWNRQLRQPVLLVQPRMLVSVSPQEGFLHQRTPLDSLGLDLTESRCRLDEKDDQP